MNENMTLFQIFEKAIYRSYISETITCLEKLYDRDSGYLVGNITITPREDGKVIFNAPIYKKSINPNIHEEVFVKSCSPSDVSSVIEQLNQTYASDTSWSLGNRYITEVDELTSVVRVELIKKAKSPFL